MKQETRIFEIDSASFRAVTENGQRFLEGYAAVFNQLSKPIYENNKLFREMITPESFTEVLSTPNLDVIYNVNHSNGSIIARTKSGTLEISVDDYGLKFRALVPNTTVGNDVYELVSRGDLFENSFAFSVKKGDDAWTTDETGANIRTINKIARLYDVSTVYSGAYANTDIAARDEDEPEVIEENGLKVCVEVEVEIGESEPEVEQPEPETPEVPAEAETDSVDEEDEKEKMRMRLRFLKLK